MTMLLVRDLDSFFKMVFRIFLSIPLSLCLVIGQMRAQSDSSPTSGLVKKQQDSKISETQIVAASGEYQLSAQDAVRIAVFHEEELTTTVRISESGEIQFPLIGTVHIAGKTVRQAAIIIEAALKQDYFVSPQVNVSVVDFAKQRFSILGQVKSPGTYAASGQSSLDFLQAIALAGGYTRSANISKIIVKRNVEGQEKIFHINGKTLTQEGNSQPFFIKNGDTIIVPESFF